jgi:hypothetical protein
MPLVKNRRKSSLKPTRLRRDSDGLATGGANADVFTKRANKDQMTQKQLGAAWSLQ